MSPSLPRPIAHPQKGFGLLSLPAELLGDIFSLPIPIANQPAEGYETRGYEWTVSEYKKYRLALTSTCSKFSSIILHTPKCWTLVDIRFFSDRGKGVTSPAALKARLERSYPLAFDLIMGAVLPRDVDVFHRHGPQAYEHLQPTLQPHLPRCRSISLISNLHNLDAVQHLTGGIELPCLAHLSLHWYNDLQYADERTSSILISFARIPPLLSLSINHSDLSGNGKAISLSHLPPSAVASLTRLNLGGSIGIRAVVNILGECCSLEHLRWCDFEFVEPYQGAALQLPRLRSLDLDGSPVCFCPPIEAPLLEAICHGREFETQGLPPSLLRTDQPALPSLRRVEWLELIGPANSITQFFRRQTRLERLSLRRCSFDRLNAALEALFNLSTLASDYTDGNMYLKSLYLRQPERPRTEAPLLDMDKKFAGMLQSINRCCADELKVSIYPVLFDSSSDMQWPQAAAVCAQYPDRFSQLREPSYDQIWFQEPWFNWHSNSKSVS
ncbi:hypothetical protein DL93DRAFT_2164343 [Clavulina sp. PMI_390]|nr:hypothetical protein DL93DRAFT_2164343 [Clavulina sp. PMI_390]